MAREKKIKKPVALLAQAKAHELYARGLGKSVPIEVVRHWEKERERYLREAEKLMDGLPPAYLEEIHQRSGELARKQFEKKKRKIKKR